MTSSWTFSKKLTASLAAVVALVLVLVGVSLRALDRAVTEQNAVIHTYGKNLLDARTLETLMERRGAEVQGLLWLEGPESRRALKETDEAFREVLLQLRERPHSPAQARRLEAVATAEASHRASLDRLLATRDRENGPEAGHSYYTAQLLPLLQDLRTSVGSFRAAEAKLRDAASEGASEAARGASRAVTGTAMAILLLAAALGWRLNAALTDQLGTSIRHLLAAALELQSSSNQQSTSCQEQVTAVHEASTTMRQLLVTSRQIGESAQHVASLAREARAATVEGDQLVTKGSEANELIRTQMENVVELMVELGSRSRRIGSVLALVNELAEQTNILSVNATIEAAGAGEQGGRFAAVAEEIRKLSARVGQSTREIRELVDEIRASVNATVMATESGSKAVQEGSARFEAFAGAFLRIADLVANTSEAAREIELSTNQQRTAVEHVTAAVEEISQAATESELGARRTHETAEQLSDLSLELGQLVQDQQGA